MAEASQLLAQLAENEQDITKWTNIAADVYGTFGDALPIEGLIESANETAKVGQVTGSLADALNWVVISEDAFNEKLASCSDESERNRLIMETLSGSYDEASAAFYRNNEALVASREGQAQLDETLAGLGETISNVKNSLRAEVLPAISDVISSFTDMINGVDGADTAFADAITGMINKAVAMLPQFMDTGMQILTSLLSGIIQSLPAVIEGAVQIIVTLAQGIVQAAPALIPQIVLVVTQIVQTLVENLPMILEAALQLITGLVQGLLDAIPVLVAALPAIITAIVEFVIGAIPQIIISIVKAVPQIISAIVKGFASGASQMASIGLNLIKEICNGISDATSWLWSKVSGFCSSLLSKIKGFFGIHSPSTEMAWVGEMLVEGLAGSIEDNGRDAVKAVEGLSAGISDVMNGLAQDIKTSLPTNFHLEADSSVRSITVGVSGGVLGGYGPLITIQQMIVRSEEDIRRISQELYNLIQIGSCAQGWFSTA